ncbi:MAG TPA: DNA polymerase III subunit alpha [Ktedonobacterales bacterium]|nr:DNA polymerase III subunit alpha [Ktedonobacterales bacterium]
MRSGYVELHCASAYSFRRAGSDVEALVARAARLGMSALALTDYMTMAGMIRFQEACARQGIRAIAGAELAIIDLVFGDAARPAHLVVLAEDAVGYARLCTLLTEANLADPEHPAISFADLARHPEGLILLTGGREGTLARLLLARRRQEAEVVARRYREAFGAARVFVELQHYQLPDSIWLMQELTWTAAAAGLRCVLTNGVRHAIRDDYALYDLLTCVRLGITVDEAHPERPRNDEAYLKGADELDALLAPIPWGPDALAASAKIAERCDLTLLKGVCTAPRVPLPAGETPQNYLRQLCENGLATRFADHPGARLSDSPYRRQMEHELAVIARLELEEFFLCVHDIVRQARQSGIRVSGRGSAANSLVAYLLGITGVDPLAHSLLFERFLNPDRKGMPDIDLDVQSDRRDELIRYVEQTYSPEHAAMVANVITYRPRSALRDTAKALGFPLPLVNSLTKVLPHHAGRDQMAGYADELVRVVAMQLRSFGKDLRAQCLARLPLALNLAARLCGLPRHLSLHNGGLVLSREPLTQILPIRISTNGVRALEINKDDIERLGLIKFDLLGLRTLGAIEEALALIEETMGKRPEVDHLPTDPPDPAAMRLVRSGQTLAVFQLESPGQWHLLAQTQPTSFDDLIVQTALFRPGPLQGGFVGPYVARRQETHQGHGVPQRDAVQTPWHGAPADDFWTRHPVLGSILSDTEGILLFQEQVLLIANQYAGLSLAEADGFRRAMSHARDPEEMAAMRGRFVSGAIARGEPTEEAMRVFDAISAYTGYGFCRSHAAEFAKTIYVTAYLKAHFPAHYLAAFLSAQPAGYFPPHVVAEEARHLGIPLLPVDINRSEGRFTVERVGTPPSRWAIRIGLAQVAHVGEELAEAILWERRDGYHIGDSDAERDRPFTSLGDFCARLRPHGLTWQAAEALVLVGAFDGLRPSLERRRRLWQLHEIWPLVGARQPGQAGREPRGGRGKRSKQDMQPRAEQLTLAWAQTVGIERVGDIPALPMLDGEEKLALDYQVLGLSARPHPMRYRRRELSRRGVRAIAELETVSEGRVVRVAGWPISAQRPPTAKGMGFLVLEDESGRIPIAFPPKLAEQMHRVIRNSRVVAVVGRVERVRWYRSLLGLDLRAVE